MPALCVQFQPPLLTGHSAVFDNASVLHIVIEWTHKRKPLYVSQITCGKAILEAWNGSLSCKHLPHQPKANSQRDVVFNPSTERQLAWGNGTQPYWTLVSAVLQG
jgi:hypothetical protein